MKTICQERLNLQENGLGQGPDHVETLARRLVMSRILNSVQVQLDAARAEAAREAATAEARAWAERMAAVEAEAARERKDNQRLQAELHAARRGVPWTPKASEVQRASPLLASDLGKLRWAGDPLELHSCKLCCDQFAYS